MNFNMYYEIIKKSIFKFRFIVFIIFTIHTEAKHSDHT